MSSPACGPAAAEARPYAPVATVDRPGRSGGLRYWPCRPPPHSPSAGRSTRSDHCPAAQSRRLWQAGHHYPGHTELLAELCGVDDFAMMLYLAPDEQVAGPAGLGMVHVTLHMALRDVFAALNRQAVLPKIRLADTRMRRLKAARRRALASAL